MNRMIRLLSLKFASLKEYIPIVELNQARQSYLETENIGDYCGRHSSLLERLEAELIPSDNKLNTTSSRNDIYISGNILCIIVYSKGTS